MMNSLNNIELKLTNLLKEVQTPYKYRCHRIIIQVDTTDILNTYGFKHMISCRIQETRSLCTLCKEEYGGYDYGCVTKEGIHNFKKVFIDLETSFGKTIEQALVNLLEMRKNINAITP